MDGKAIDKVLAMRVDVSLQVPGDEDGGAAHAAR